MLIRVLHLCEPFNPGGTQWWLIDIAKTMPRDEYALEFACFGNDVGTRADEVRALGCSVSAITPSLEEILQGHALRRIIRQGHYDIVHAHMFNLSGWQLRHAHDEGVGVRIAHFHTTNDGRRWSPSTALRRAVSRQMIRVHANAVLACSRAVYACVPLPRRSLSNGILSCGVETAKYSSQSRDRLVRQALGISENAPVVGHVGRFVSQKNHKGLIEILKLLHLEIPNVCLVLIGDGPLKTAIEKQVASSGLSAQVRFLGTRADIERILPSFDVFCFPSVSEGLPISVLEARMAGTPVVASAIPQIEEALAGCNGGELIAPGNYQGFASALAKYLRWPIHISPPQDWVARFSRERSANQLAAFYTELLEAVRINRGQARRASQIKVAEGSRIAE